jgi:hypothetical protein
MEMYTISVVKKPEMASCAGHVSLKDFSKNVT